MAACVTCKPFFKYNSAAQVHDAPDVAQQNQAGQSIEDLAEAHMLKAELADRYKYL